MRRLRRRFLYLRLLQRILLLIALILLLMNLFIHSWEVRVFSMVILIVWAIISIITLYYMIRVRRVRRPYAVNCI
ncbi:MAG: hypothetical protein NDF52_07960 [archaeon YNP-WB-062]|nr:hypothetical protein [Candidatus Culexarchaeum yellowstonense]